MLSLCRILRAWTGSEHFRVGAVTSLPLFVLEEMMALCLRPASNSGDLGPVILRHEIEA
jgi:hypothetical protein